MGWLGCSVAHARHARSTAARCLSASARSVRSTGQPGVHGARSSPWARFNQSAIVRVTFAVSATRSAMSRTIAIVVPVLVSVWPRPGPWVDLQQREDVPAAELGACH